MTQVAVGIERPLVFVALWQGKVLLARCQDGFKVILSNAVAWMHNRITVNANEALDGADEDGMPTDGMACASPWKLLKQHGSR